MKKLKESKENLKNLIIIASYQEPIIEHIRSTTDKFHESELYEYNENTFHMYKLDKDLVLIPLIRFFLSKNRNFRIKYLSKSLDEIKNYKIRV